VGSYFVKPSFSSKNEFYKTAKILTQNAKYRFTDIIDIEYFGFMRNLHINVYVKDDMKDNFYKSDMIFEYLKDCIRFDDNYYNLRKDFYYITSSGAPENSDALMDVIEVRISNQRDNNIEKNINDAQISTLFTYQYSDYISQSYTIVIYNGKSWEDM